MQLLYNLICYNIMFRLNYPKITQTLCKFIFAKITVGKSVWQYEGKSFVFAIENIFWGNRLADVIFRRLCVIIRRHSFIFICVAVI